MVDSIIFQVLFWEKTQSKIDKLKLRLSEIYYDNLLRVRSFFFDLVLLKCMSFWFPELFRYWYFQLTEPKVGLRDWLDAVSTARIPCAVVSNLDRKNMISALERMGLQKYFQASNSFRESPYFLQIDGYICWFLYSFLFQAVVSEEDGMESIAHRFLSAAVKVP